MSNLVVELIILFLFLFWLYVSVRKYGAVDTIAFIAISPFLLVQVFVNYFTATQGIGNKNAYKKFLEEARYAVNGVINEVYDGKVLEVKVVKSQVVVTLETPFGLRMPTQEFIAALAKKLDIRDADISCQHISERKSYIVFSSGAHDTYMKAQSKKTTIETPQDLLRRLLCQSKPGIIQ